MLQPPGCWSPHWVIWTLICCGSHVSWDFFVRADCWSVCSQALASSRSRICLWPIAGYAGMRNGSVVFTTGRPRESHGNFADNSREDVFFSREVARCCISWVLWHLANSREVRRFSREVRFFLTGSSSVSSGRCRFSGRRAHAGQGMQEIAARAGVPADYISWTRRPRSDELARVALR